MTKQRYQISGMHCVSCAMLVDGVLEDLAGVKTATTSYARQCVDVEYDDKAVTEEAILQTIKEAGYDAARAS